MGVRHLLADNVPGLVLSGVNRGQNVAEDVSYSGTIAGVEAQGALDHLHYASAAAVGFARGLNDTPKIAALLLGASALVPSYGIIAVAVVMALGGLISARRVAETMSHRITTMNHGQGHETSYAQMVSGWLGIPIEDIHLAQADTDQITIGRGTYASRSMMVGGSALRAAADDVIDKGKKFAAHFMEADAADVDFADGKFVIAGTDKEMPIGQVAQMSYIPVGLPAELGIGLQGAGAFAAHVPSFPNGCHICEVEVDPETGAVTIDRYSVVDDIGTVINPLLAAGQLHGGLAQGIGQAALERVAYDPESGQLLSGSFMDFALPRADDMPDVTVAFNPVEGDDNPLGVKGIGEGPTTASPPTVVNAVLDALAPRGVSHIDMPLTPETVWRALADAAQR